jgi:hypothetical protein
MACFESMTLKDLERIKDINHYIFDYLHKVMYMFVNSNEIIESFNGCGREKMVEIFEQYRLDDSWTQYFWTYYCQFGM